MIARRLETARIELAACDEFDNVIVNDEVTSACEQLVSLFVSTNSR
ncbi:guanylate kinase [Mycobacteroides abscessus subsp. abscessus]|nr:guanylate kinase [Mycobacteroides abscessus subsp. abscessus]